MRTRFSSASFGFSAVAFVLEVGVLAAAQSGWTIPPSAASEQNPQSSPDALKKGESLYKSNCAGCHGPKGLGDGPDVDKKERRSKPANLVQSRNPEGIVFYKI